MNAYLASQFRKSDLELKGIELVGPQKKYQFSLYEMSVAKEPRDWNRCENFSGISFSEGYSFPLSLNSTKQKQNLIGRSHEMITFCL